VVRLKNITALFLTLQILFGPFTQPARRVYANGMSEDARTIDAASADEEGAQDARARKGLSFRLSEGAEEPEASAPRSTPARAEKLSEADTDACWGGFRR
jgi:hypothetical protein